MIIIVNTHTSLRRHVAEYISTRDGGVACDWRNVMLCAGASEGIRAVLKLMTNPGGENILRQGEYFVR